MCATRPLDRVIVGDCIREMEALPEACADVVFADPPYNLQLRGELRRPNDSVVDGVDAAWDRVGTFADYDAFSRAWLAAARRVLKPDGTLWLIGTYHNIYRLGALLQDLDFWILNEIVWRKTNPMPNFRGRRFTNAHETLIWAARGQKSRYCFNYSAMKALNDGVQMRSDWLIPICTGQERLRDDSGAKAHPTQKPEELLYRVIMASTRPGDVVLDPFFGTGTTGAVARRLHRHWIGIEADPDHARRAEARIATVDPVDDLESVAIEDRRSAPRVPFGWVVERGLLKPGSVLTDFGRRWSAKVRADGTVVSAEYRGSIHQVGAAVQGASACNGWTFWHYPRQGQLTPIDHLRQQLVANLS